MYIQMWYHAVDGAQRSASFKTLRGARNFATRWVGENPEVSASFSYAVSPDGIGTVWFEGVSAQELFPKFFA